VAIDPFDLEVGPSLLGGGSSFALTVSQLAQHLRALVREDVILQDVWVRGEVSNFTRAGSGHLYLSLKDADACISCVVWRSAAQWLSFRPENGMQLLAHGSFDVYAPRGQCQLIIDEIQPDGVGALHVALEQARARLLDDGLLDADRKRPLPAFPRTVALVTSPSGAALRDMCVILQRAVPAPEIVLVPALVQGAGAEQSLCDGLALANRESGADLIIIGRGGGSIEDLWTFNSEALARAIAASPLPVISAVGHETDYTLADMVADVRAATPTAAAEMVVAQRLELWRRYEQAVAAVHALFAGRLENARLHYQGIARSPVLARPLELVESRRQRLDDLNGRLLRAREVCVTRWRHRFALAAGKLDGLSPLATLARGYATVARLPEGEPVKSVESVAAGDRVRIQLADGALEAVVEQVERT